MTMTNNSISVNPAFRAEEKIPITAPFLFKYSVFAYLYNIHYN